MDRLFLTLALALMVVGGPQAADDPKQCADFIDRAGQLNAGQLFSGIAPCFAEKRSFDATLLQVEGQIRAMADMETLAAATDEDKMKGAQLYGQIFYATGGAGDRDLYRNPSTMGLLFERIEAWTPSFDAGYDPGWHYRRRPTDAAYYDSIKYQKSYRLAQLRWYASLVRNDEYYVAESEVHEIQQRNPRGIVAGSEDYVRMQALSATMRRVSASVASPKLPPERPFVFEPDPDASFKQVFSGFNGLEKPGVTFIQSRAELTTSWISSALPQADLERVVSGVNFDSQILIAFAIGERMGATGRVIVADATYNTLLKSMLIEAAVGVNGEDCRLERVKSYPFALVVAARPPVVPAYPGYGLSNFGDGCQPPKSGIATAASAARH
jgi:hypothetical protein